MANKLPSIKEAFKKVVAATDAAIQANAALNFGTLSKRVHFMHGHPKEIVALLQAYSQSPTHKNQKYPLIALIRDIREELSDHLYGFSTSFKGRLVICTITKPEYRADKREELNFIPILHPIFEEFINQLSLSEDFGTPTVDEMKIVKFDRYYWGTQSADANKLNDCIDAVEIESISLKIKNNICP